ncbi:SHOCT domain-containing protein [Variovorax dokdonensis]|uniref:SHOCT domain-containing protein n=1 Tax=Variovorax dokdonensis TaxID=344883 RepID=A0ABT7N6E9_9BURK|nr:SHOCT domain-containing protein [Variovorax dokdonensis]MDM0043519.1 SHOCT domain-containing protein [Variovorax dokdonensis]
MQEQAKVLAVSFSLVPVLVLIGCGQTSAIQASDKSTSHFANATFKGETTVLAEATKGSEQYRLFQQGATGYVSLQSVRDDVELRASQFCDRKGQSMNALRETTSVPPHILGNFPRAELEFECVPKPMAAAASAQTDDAKFNKLSNLKKLLDNGTLTQAEFEQEKKKVLAQP